MKLRLKNRIAFFTAGAAALTMGLVFWGLYRVVYLTAYRHLDEDIRQEKEDVLEALNWTEDSIYIDGFPEWEEKEHQQVEVNPVFLQVMSRTGKPIFSSSNLKDNVLSGGGSWAGDTFFNSSIADQRLRVGQFPIVTQRGHVIGVLLVGISQEESAAILDNLYLTLWIALPLVLMVLFSVTSLAASKSIAPLKSLISATAKIGDANITARLSLPEHEDEIYQLATTINELLERIEYNMQRQKQFTADASHEIRTPLTAIRGTLEVLIRKQRSPLQYEEKIQRVILEVDRLYAMLEQLLQLARLEAGQIRINHQPLVLDAYVKGVTEKWQPVLQEKNINLSRNIPASASLNTDVALLTIMLDNLIGNAIKYGREGGHISCSWEASRHTLVIQDDGPGIPAQQLPYIFDRFYRLDDSRNSNMPGAGLGLSITKKLAELQNIHLSASSEEGQGLRYELVFPAH